MFPAGDSLDGFSRHIARFFLVPPFDWLGGKVEAGLRQVQVAWRAVGFVAAASPEGAPATRLRGCVYLASFWLVVFVG